MFFNPPRKVIIAMSEENKNVEAEPHTTQCPNDDGNKPKRDRSGRFVSKTPKPNLDGETVKIRIIKDEKPLPPKDFSGRLEDEKEHTAISFIRSVVAHKPKVIDIDGEKFYDRKVVARILAKYEDEKKKRIFGDKLWSEIFHQEKLVVDEYQKRWKRCRRERNFWFVMAMAYVIMFLSLLIPSLSKGEAAEAPQTTMVAE